MGYFLLELYTRNQPLFLFGAICLLGAAFCVTQIRSTNVQVMGINAWYKPLKFCLSTVFYSWTMGWYIYYLGAPQFTSIFNWVVIIGLGFEIVYIAYQAGRGQTSHYNQSTPFHGAMFGLMALAATVVTIFTCLVGLYFFSPLAVSIPDHYLWSIRLGIFVFVIFSFQGFLMGGNGAHTVGAPDGSKGIPLLNWSMSHGDLRIAHFVGMHALQVLPFVSYYILRDVVLTFCFAGLYLLLAVFTLQQALKGRPLIRAK